MRVIVTGGGTGGHVNPALSIAEIIKKYEPDSEFLFVGTQRGIENKLVKKAGYEIKHVEVSGLKRKFTKYNIKVIKQAITSPRKAKKIIREFRPDIAVGTGGYVCWPVIRAASSMKIPTVLHESNAIAGVAVKMLQKYVDRIYLNFEETADTLKEKDKVLRVGNPIPDTCFTLGRDEARKMLGIEDRYRYVILSYGGSLGAHNVNEAVLSLMKDFVSGRDDVYHFHASGSIEKENMFSKFEEAGLDGCENISLSEYIYDMPVKMAAADIVICRAGAMTVSELAAAGKCAVFIPSPNVAENHQYKNAKALYDKDAALLIEEKDLMGNLSLLKDSVKGLLENEEKIKKMSENIRSFAVRDAGKLIYEDIKTLLK